MHHNYQNSGYNYGQGNYGQGQQQQQMNPQNQQYQQNYNNNPHQFNNQSQFSTPNNQQQQNQNQRGRQNNRGGGGRKNFNQNQNQNYNQNAPYQQQQQQPGPQQQNHGNNNNSNQQMFQQSSMQQPSNNNQNQNNNRPNNRRKRGRGGGSGGGGGGMQNQHQNQNQNQQQNRQQPTQPSPPKQQRQQSPQQQAYGGVMSQANAYPQSSYSDPMPALPVTAYQPTPQDNAFAAAAATNSLPVQTFVQNAYAAAVNVNQFASAVNVPYQQVAMNAYQGYPQVVQPMIPQQPPHPYEKSPPVKKNEGRGASSSSVSRGPALNQNAFAHQQKQNQAQSHQANSSNNYNNFVAPSTSYQQVDLIHQMQAEKTEFDLQFERWEKEFADWKKINANHPDKTAYAKYAQEFEKVRQQLLKRREEMRIKTITTAPPPPPDPVKDAQRANFESQWNASSDANIPSTSSQLGSQSLSDRNFNFTSNMDQFNKSHVDFQNDTVEIFESFGETFKNKTENFASLFGSSRSSIPFLESEVPQEKEKPAEKVLDVPIVDLETAEENLEEDNFEFPPVKTPTTTNEPPPLPEFTVPGETREIIDIRQLLDPPARYDRNDKIVIFIRGAPGSGKTHLARLILERERKISQNHSKFLSIHKYTQKWGFERENLVKYQDSLVEDLRDVLKSRIFNFIVVEVPGFIFLHMKKMTMMVGGFKYRAYLIELHQPIEVCRKYNVNERSFDDIKHAVEGLVTQQDRPPLRMCAIDATIILDPEYKGKIPREQTTIQEPIPLQTEPAIDNTLSNFDFSQILANKNVLELVQSQINTTNNATKSPDIPEAQQPIQSNVNTQSQHRGVVHQQETPAVANQSHFHHPVNPPSMSNQSQYPINHPPPMQNIHEHHQQQQFSFTQQQLQPQNQFFHQPPPQQLLQRPQLQQQLHPPVRQQPTIAEIPIYVPKKTFDYGHKNIPSIEDQMLEFKIFRVIDYKNKTTRSLYEFIKDIDVDKIIEKKKAILLRRKTLAYLRNAERPEDTVSNPKYPKNWEPIIPVDRPASKTKRGKRKTAKILRIIARRNPAKKLNLRKLAELTEDISDDEEVMNEIADAVTEKKKEAEAEDETKDWTIPKFKMSKRDDMQSIKEILNYPARLVRPRQIMFILRGAPGSGKSHLAQLIKRKEKAMQNENLRILSINDYYESSFESDDEGSSEHLVTGSMVGKFSDQMMKQLERTIKDEFNFIIIDAENCDLKYYNLFHLLGLRKFYTVYTIELRQTLDICTKQNKLSRYRRSEGEISEAIELLEKNKTPLNHNVIDATSIYEEYKCLTNAKLKAMMDLEEVSDDEKFSDEDNMFEELPDDPRIPNFNWHLRQKNFKNLKDLLEEPGRKKRPDKIMIILRGPTGSGKTYLSGLIRNRETELGGGDKFMALSIDDYFIDKATLNYKYNVYEVPENQKSMIRSLKEIIRKNSHKFIVIDAENGTLEEYNQYYSIGSGNGYRCYAIELHQSMDICKSQNVHDRLPRDMENVLDDMKLTPLPDNHISLNASYLYSMAGLESCPPPVVEKQQQEPELQPQVDFLKRCKLPLIINGDIVKVEGRQDVKLPEFNWHNRETIDIQSVFDNQSTEMCFILLRGAPGSGKTYLASQIAKRQHAEGRSDEFAVVSQDEQFTKIEEKDAQMYLRYEFKSDKYGEYMEQTVKSFEELVKKKEKKFIVVDADNCELKYCKMFFDAGTANGYTGYTIELNQDEDVCIRCNDHRRSEQEIRMKVKLLNDNPIGAEQKLVDPESLYQCEEFEGSLSEDEEFESTFGPLKNNSTASKWDDVDQQDLVIDKLDGTKNKTLTKFTMAEYLKTEEDEWTMRPSTSGKKRVRWADIEEKKEQNRMREVGFIVGQTDWSRMTDTSDGKNALEKTRYIEPRNK